MVRTPAPSVSLSAPSTFSIKKSMSRPSRCISVRSKSGSADGFGGGGGGGGRQRLRDRFLKLRVAQVTLGDFVRLPMPGEIAADLHVAIDEVKDRHDDQGA